MNVVYNDDTDMWSGTAYIDVIFRSVGVLNIQYWNGSQYVDATGMLYVPVDEPLTLVATPEPAPPEGQTAFPPGTPVWTVDTMPVNSDMQEQLAEEQSWPPLDSITITPDKTGNYALVATSGNDFVPVTFTAVSLDSITGTEVSAGTATGNSITAQQIALDKLFVCPGNTVQLSVAITPANATPALARILFKLVGTGASPSTGSFSGQPKSVSLQEETFYDVWAGWDLDNNGVLDSEEYQLLFFINPVVLGDTVEAQRLSADPDLAENYYPIKDGEHFEVGGQFQFCNVGGTASAVTPSSLIKWQLWDLDGIDDLISSGSAYQFNYTFGTGVAEGDTYVRYYADNNGNGTRDSGETYKDSEEFWVQTKYVYSVNTQYSNLITSPISAAIIQARFDAAGKVLLKKDSADDWRACVGFYVASAAQFVAGANRPDPCNAINMAECALHYDVTDICFVDTLTGAGGVTWGYDWRKIIIDWSTNFTWLERAIAHEFGHGVGLDHAGHASPQIMHSGVLTGADNELTEDDADEYD